MCLLVVRYVHVVVPVVFDKIDRTAARVVLMAVFAPLLRVSRWHPQVNRLRRLHDTLDDDRLWIDDLRRRNVPNIDATVKAGLSNADRDSNIRSPYRTDRGG